MNQWELKANTRNQRQARENACNQAAIGFGGARFLNQSQSLVM